MICELLELLELLELFDCPPYPPAVGERFPGICDRRPSLAGRCASN